jgi:hypothetical protein
MGDFMRGSRDHVGPAQSSRGWAPGSWDAVPEGRVAGAFFGRLFGAVAGLLAGLLAGLRGPDAASLALGAPLAGW